MSLFKQPYLEYRSSLDIVCSALRRLNPTIVEDYNSFNGDEVHELISSSTAFAKAYNSLAGKLDLVGILFKSISSADFWALDRASLQVELVCCTAEKKWADHVVDDIHFRLREVSTCFLELLECYFEDNFVLSAHGEHCESDHCRCPIYNSRYASPARSRLPSISIPEGELEDLPELVLMRQDAKYLG